MAIGLLERHRHIAWRGEERSGGAIAFGGEEGSASRLIADKHIDLAMTARISRKTACS